MLMFFNFRDVYIPELFLKDVRDLQELINAVFHFEVVSKETE